MTAAPVVVVKRKAPNRWPSLTVGRQQLLAVCELLGVNPDVCCSITLHPREVAVELYVVDENGARQYDRSTKEPVTHTTTMAVI